MAFTLRTDPELEQALADLAAAQGVSKQEVIRRAVLAEAERSRTFRDIDAVLDSELPRYAVALKRLGQ